jgi:nuclear receptor subfamily 0 group A
MSKSGSRYGRRSNWFKIHCLLQEQQQAAQQQGNHKQNSSSPFNMLGHPSYPHSMYGRPPCTKEELMLLGIEEYSKHPSASPSVSSPDSHNSDSSVEVGDRRNALLRQGKLTDPSSHGLNKEMFLPLHFAGLPLMPPPGFLPPSHLLFPGYHAALYPQQQHGLLKPAAESPLSSSPSLANNNSQFTPNHNTKSSKTAEAFTKRFYLDAVLNSQRSPSNCTIEDIEKEHDIDVHIDDETPTPVSSPPKRRSPVVHNQDNPIDLSMRTGSSCTSDDHRASSSAESITSEDDVHEKRSLKASGSDSDDETQYKREIKRLKIQGTTPLDLTTKV